MKKIALPYVAAIILGGVIWLVGCDSESASDSNADLVTEVAVYTGKVVRTDLHSYVTAYGRVEPAPANSRNAASARVSSAVGGVISDIRVSEGQLVAKGDLLFQIDSRAADEVVSFARKNMARQKQLAADGAASAKVVEAAQHELDAALVQQALLKVTSPVAGTLSKLNISLGQSVDSSTLLAEVVDMNQLVVSAEVPSIELAVLQVGQRAYVTADKSTTTVEASLSYIGNQIDSGSGTGTVRIALPENSGLLPGQFVELGIVSEEHLNRLAVPLTSLVRNEEGAEVVALVTDGIAQQIPVTSGIREGDLVEVSGAGLDAGMTVVTLGAYGLPEQTKVRVLGD